MRKRMQSLHKSKSTKKIGGVDVQPLSHNYLKRANSNGMLLRQNLNNSHDVELMKSEKKYEQLGKKLNNQTYNYNLNDSTQMNKFGFMFYPYQQNQESSKIIELDEEDKRKIRASLIN